MLKHKNKVLTVTVLLISLILIRPAGVRAEKQENVKEKEVVIEEQSNLELKKKQQINIFKYYITKDNKVNKTQGIQGSEYKVYDVTEILNNVAAENKETLNANEYTEEVRNRALKNDRNTLTLVAEGITDETGKLSIEVEYNVDSYKAILIENIATKNDKNGVSEPILVILPTEETSLQPDGGLELISKTVKNDNKEDETELPLKQTGSKRSIYNMLFSWMRTNKNN